jgi:hypothetical protein
MIISVLGNCQAGPISDLLSQHKDIKTINKFIIHLSDNSSRDSDIKKFNESNFILAQNTSDEFQPEHMSSKWLRNKYKEKVIIWPNIFYIGQQPFIRYMTSKKGRFQGPLGDYHHLKIILNWIEKKYNNINKDLFDSDYINKISKQSLNDLESKEGHCDINISEDIHKNINNELLFFSFNHPSAFLLNKIYKKILKEINLPFQEANFKSKLEPLSTYIMPSIWPIKIPNNTFRGNNMDNNQKKQKFKVYNYEQLENAFFDHYDKSFKEAVDIESLRFTPPMKEDLKVTEYIKNCLKDL